MKKYQLMVLVLVLAGLAVSLAAGNWKTKSTDHFKISIPSDWDDEFDDDFYIAYDDVDAERPITIMISIEELSKKESKRLSTRLLDFSIKKFFEDIEDMDMEEVVEIVEIGETRIDGKKAIRIMTEFTIEEYEGSFEYTVIHSGDKIVLFGIFGLQDELNYQKQNIDSIKKSLIVK